MKITDIIPVKWLPASVRHEIAMEKTREFVKKAASRDINRALVRTRQFVAALKQDELKVAIEWAEQIDRPRRDLLYAIYKQVLKDGHFSGEMGKTINKVVGSPFGLFKKGTEEIDEKATRLLQREWFEEYRTYFEEARFWGHSLIQFKEKTPSLEEGLEFEFKSIELIEREHVRPETGTIVMDVNDETGIPYREGSWMKDLWLVEMGKPKNLGVLQIIAREVIWKNYSRSDWSRHSEKFGMPMITAKTDTTNKKELDNLADMLQNFGNNLWAILDTNDEIDLKEPTFKDSYQIYKEKALFCNSEMSKATSWQTGTSDEKAFVGGAKVHERILDDYVEARKRLQTYHINSVTLPFLIEHGYPVKDREFRYISYQDASPEDDQEHTGDQKPGANNKPAGGRAAKKPNRPESLYS